MFPKTYGSDRRKPVSARFQEFCEAVYWPLVNALLFGLEGWQQVRPHLTAFKVNTLQISADEFYYGQAATLTLTLDLTLTRTRTRTRTRTLPLSRSYSPSTVP